MEEETGNTPGAAGDDDKDWLYEDNDELEYDIDDDDDKKTEVEIFSALTGDVEAHNQDVTDNDDNLPVTTESSSISVNPGSLGITTISGTKGRGEALAALDNNIIAASELEENEELQIRPWEKPGADLSDYFNYGFNRDTWKDYCAKQKRMRRSRHFMYLCSSDKNTARFNECASKSDSYSRKYPKSTITVIQRQRETTVHSERRKHRSRHKSHKQVQSSAEHPVDAEPSSSTQPPFFSRVIPPPPVSPPRFRSTSYDKHDRQSKRPSLDVPPSDGGCSGFPRPRSPFTSGSGRSRRSYEGCYSPPYPLSANVYSHPLRHKTWMDLSDQAKTYKYSSCHDRHDRDRGKDRGRTWEEEWDRKAKQERERDQENTSSFQSHSSYREWPSRHRDHGEQDRRREHDREGRQSERERESERVREIEREIEIEKQRAREIQREIQGEIERERDIERERQRAREIERARDIQREIEREKEIEREREDWHRERRHRDHKSSYSSRRNRHYTDD